MASSTTPSEHHPPSFALPPSQLAQLQPHAYLLAHLSPPSAAHRSLRPNGRSPLEFRTTSANAGSLTHTNGSAVVRMGDATAVCGVRAEILDTEEIAAWGVSSLSGTSRWMGAEHDDDDGDDSGDGGDSDGDNDDSSQIHKLNLLVPNLSLSTGCTPGLIPGAPPSALAQSLSHQILSLLHTSRLVRARDLRIWYYPPNLSAMEREHERELGDDTEMDTEMDTIEEGNGGHRASEPVARPEIKAFWVLYIDVLIISLAANPFDAAWVAVLAALRDVKLPRAWWDADSSMVLCSDAASEAKRLALRGMPIASSYCVFEADPAISWRAVMVPTADEQNELKKDTQRAKQRWILADPDGFEEILCQERVNLVVDQDRNKKTMKIVRMEKNGGLSVGKEELRMLIDISIERWRQLKGILDGLR